MKTVSIDSFTLNTDDTVMVVGALLSTAVNLVRDPGQGAAYAGDPETFIVLADKIATAFVNAAMAHARAVPADKDVVFCDCYDVASTMSAGIDAYQSWAGEIQAKPQGFDEVGTGATIDDCLDEIESAGETLREYAQRKFSKKDLN